MTFRPRFVPTATPLEDRLTPADLTGAEQYFLELVNRARANPAGEAARFGIELNEGLTPGTISTSPSQPLAPNMQVTAAIDGQLAYLAGLGTLSHTGPGGSRPGDRVAAQGYNWTTVGENLAVSGGISADKAGADELHRLLFVDEGYPGRGHRVIMLRGTFEEVGVGLASGPFAGFPAVYGGTDFAARDGNPFITGVVYTDAVTADRFYTPGEGIGGASVTATGAAGTFRTSSMTAGGYALQVPAGTYTVTFATPSGQSGSTTVTVGGSNVKADYVPTGGAASPPTAPPVSVPPVTPAPSATLPAGGLPARSILVGADAGGSSVVRAIDPTNGRTLGEIPTTGTAGSGARVASADVNADGVPDAIIGTGPGVVTQVRVVDGRTGTDILSIQPFEAAFRGGVYVAAGDLNGDGRADIVVTPDEGGGPRVDVYSGAGFAKLASFFGIDDPNFRGGARPAVGDFNGDRAADLIVTAGFGGGPRVAGFDGRSVAAGRPAKMFNDFFAFETGLRNGIFVAAGDVDGDGRADLVAGGGPGGAPRVTVFSGAALLTNRQQAVSDFFAGDLANRGGVRVSADDLDGDGRADVVTGSGSGGGSRVSAFLSRGGRPASAAAFGVDVFPGFGGGVFVG